MSLLFPSYSSSSSSDNSSDDEDDVHFLLLLMLMEEEENEEKKQKFLNRLTLQGKRRRDRRLPRTVLLHPSASAWQKLYLSGNDQAMITVTGFDCNAFQLILAMFLPYFQKYTPWTGNMDGTSYRKLKRIKNPKEAGRKRVIEDFFQTSSHRSCSSSKRP
jgi:hypothetical protein